MGFFRRLIRLIQGNSSALRFDRAHKENEIEHSER